MSSLADRPGAAPRSRVVAARVHDSHAPPGPPVEYQGLVTRAIAFAADAAVINAVAIVVTAVGALILSVLSLPDELDTAMVAVGGVLYWLWSVGYFVTFWATTGQTPGNRLLHIRVEAAEGGVLRPRRAALRLVGVVLAAIPLFAGFLPILLDGRRRGLHDMLARSVVVGIVELKPPTEPPRPRSPAS